MQKPHLHARIYAFPDANNCPWGELKVDVVLECSGFYTSKEKALFLGTLCTAVSGMSLFAQAGVSYAKSAKETTEASSEEATEVETEEETSEEVTYPITIEHAFGETVIESKQERIATVGWGNQDTPLALGIVPVGVSAANYGLVTDHKLHLWTDEAFADLVLLSAHRE